MTFANQLLWLLKRIANLESVHASTEINEDGEFQLEALAVVDQQIASLGTITEKSTKAEIAEFERQLDMFEQAQEAERVAEDKRAGLIYEVLGKLSKEERLLIERPLPEDLPAEDSEGDER